MEEDARDLVRATCLVGVALASAVATAALVIGLGSQWTGGAPRPDAEPGPRIIMVSTSR